MPDKSASTSEHRKERRAPKIAIIWFKRIICSFGIAIMILWTAYVAMRLKTTYDLQTRFEVLAVEHEELKKRYDAHLLQQNHRLDYIEQVLFGEVLAKIDKKPVPTPMRLEPWLANTIKDMRERITVLERARLRGEQEK